MKKSAWYYSVLIAALLVSTGCSPRCNIKKSDRSTAPQRTEISHQDDKTLIFVALSGGGTRAATMSWKALETFKKIPYTYYDRHGNKVESNLADEIDYISGISGGSFAAAAFCMYKGDMDVFRKRFIECNIQGDLIKGLFIPPWQGLRLLSPYYDRINMAAELYDEKVFDKKTFKDLPAHPVLWTNATHLALGNRFTFTEEYFDLLDSELGEYPIGYACAASSAFPILLSPLTLINYGEARDLSADTKYKVAKLNARSDVEKDFYCRMREFYNNKTNKFMHLADGGLVDNQGLQAIIDQFDTNGIINKKLDDSENPLKRLIIINVNAGVKPDDRSCKKKKAPHIDSVIEYTMVTSMDILSAKRWMQIKELAIEVNKAIIAGKKKSLSQLEKPYAIEVNFRNVEDDAVRARCNRLPTSFHLKPAEIDLIDGVVPELVAKDPDMIRLKKALQL